MYCILEKNVATFIYYIVVLHNGLEWENLAFSSSPRERKQGPITFCGGINYIWLMGSFILRIQGVFLLFAYVEATRISLWDISWKICLGSNFLGRLLQHSCVFIVARRTKIAGVREKEIFTPNKI